MVASPLSAEAEFMASARRARTASRCWPGWESRVTPTRERKCSTCRESLVTPEQPNLRQIHLVYGELYEERGLPFIDDRPDRRGLCR
jgi:hypothetical protein